MTIETIVRKLGSQQSLNSAEVEELIRVLSTADQVRASAPALLDNPQANNILNGDMYASRFLAIDSNGNIRVAISSRDLFNDYGVHGNILGRDSSGGNQFWISSDDGSAYFASGAGSISSLGILMNGLFYPVQFTATNAGNLRTGRLGMTLLPGATIPSLQAYFNAPPGTNLVTNGNFSTTDLTGFTDTSSAWSVLLGADSQYYARHNPTVLGLPGELTQVVAGLAAGSYVVQFDSQNAFGYLTPRIFIDWRKSDHSVIRTDTILGNSGASWQSFSQTLTSPALTAEANIRMNAGGDPFQEALFRNIFLATASATLTTTWTDIGFQIDYLPVILQEIANPVAPAPGYQNQFANNTYGVITSQNSAGKLAFPSVGSVSHVYNKGAWAAQAIGTSVALAANGGCIAMPVDFAAAGYLQSVTITNGDAASTRTWNWYLCVQNTNTGNSSENTLTVIASGTQSSFTGTGNAARTSAWAAGSQFIPPGAYWLVIQNQHATNTFSFGLQTVTNTLAQTMSQTKTVTNPIGATLDFHAATWSKRTGDIPLAVIHCAVFGETSAW